MLKSIHLQNFRSYKKADFNFSDKSTLVVGPNTIGKSNLLEAIFLISIGKSFRTDKDFQMLSLGKEVGRVSALVDDLRLEVVVTNGDVGGVKTQYKKFLVNGVAKKRVDFAGNLLSVLFSPSDLDIIVDSPSLRRNFLDNVLEQVDRNYRIASIAFSKALRQRNALLELVKDTGFKNEKQFEYWDNLVIQNGQIITQKRQEFIDFVNNTQKDIFEFIISYDKSTISRDRLNQYKVEEQAAGVTLVGPHRDDFSVSELDSVHINLVLDQVGKQQTIITTTHKEFVAKSFLKNMEVIELENGKKNFLV